MNYKQEMILKMKMQQFKSVLIAAILVSTAVYGQDDKKRFKEEFKVKPDVVIDVNTRHTDIEIITWDKNEVVVEAFMKVEGEEIDNKMRDEFYNKWNFDAYGNSSKITVKSRSDNYIDISSFNFDAPDYSVFHATPGVKNGYTFVMPDISIQGLDILDSIDFVLPELPEVVEFPELPELPEFKFVMPDLPPMPSKFDYDAYKKDKSYLERWKKENEDLIGKNAEVTVRKNSISIKSKKGRNKSHFSWEFSNDKEERAAEIAENLEEYYEKARERYEERREEMERRNEERKIRMKQRREDMEVRLKERKEQRKLANEQRKLALVERQEAREKERRKIQSFIRNRDKVKIKRHIVIRAPKDAKFNLDVKYGSMSIPK